MVRKLTWFMALILPLVALLALAPPTLAQGPPPQATRDMAAEQEILGRLAQVNPAAAPVFKAATEAMDRGDLAAAKAGYAQALSLAPDFPDALRRLSYVELGSGEAKAALEHAGRAYDKEPSPWNELALADALLAQPDRAQRTLALPHARWVADQALLTNFHAQWTLFQAAAAANDEPTARTAADRMLSVDPNQPVGHYARAIVALAAGQSATATAELDRAEALGLPASALAPLRAEMDKGPLGIRNSWYRLTVAAVVLWLLVGLALFVAGVILSRMALSAINRYQTKGEFDLGPAERRIRSVYKWVITVASAYFYVSIPFLILTVLAVYGGILYVILRMGYIPVYFSLALIVGAVTSVIAVVRSLFVRIRDTEPGRPLTRQEAPQLWQVVEDVGRHVDSRPVDVIYLTPGTEIAVMERGNLWRKMRGTARRCLILGLGALPGMPLPQFQAILAHEYGHFSNKDTSGGTLANQVQVSLIRLAEGLARRGLAKWYNPAWLFVNGFYRLFMRATRGASRLQEVLADRYAALAYGADNLIAGLLFIIRRDLNFEWEADYQIRLALQTQRDLANLYAVAEPTVNNAQKEINAAYEAVVNRKTALYDTHPSVKDRIALLEKLPKRPAEAGQERDVQDLLPIYDALAQEMTHTVEQRVMTAELRKLKREA
ncbi:MAG: M48 family metallopeptidase [Anaerolineae bacterium]